LDAPRNEPARSWSRVTPVAAPEPSYAAQPTIKPVFLVPHMSAPSYHEESLEDYSAAASEPVYHGHSTPAPEPVEDYAAPAAATQSRQDDEVPDVETIDVPERVVALADDLDIPELNFEEDQPSAPAYDDLDAEFASLLTEM
ncbi:hypothetical protein EN826_032510, partial [Mesorhizobium sp. M1D.F.Ca.ET.183.01.1.1]